MPEIPDGARQPQDHKPTAEKELERSLAEDDLLGDMPELTPPVKLRLRQRNTVMKLALGLRNFVPAPDPEEVEAEKAKYSKYSTEELADLLEVRGLEVDGGRTEQIAVLAEGDAQQPDLDMDTLTDEQLGAFLDALADIDEFAESIAKDRAAYAEWAEGKSYDTFTSLLSRYSSAVGK